MGDFDMERLVRLAFFLFLALVFGCGAAAGFGVASLVNIGRLCL